MSNIPILDGTGGTAYLSATGTGTDISPFVPTQNMQGTVAVSNLPASQTVAGTVSVAAGTVAVSNFPGSQTVAGTVGVSNWPAAQTVNGTVLVGSGTVAVNPITWTPFYAKYATSGDGTPIAAVAGSAIWFQELNIIAGQTINNNIVVKYGTATVREVPLTTRMEGVVWSFGYPDYVKLPTNTALITNLEASGTVSVFGRYCLQPG